MLINDRVVDNIMQSYFDRYDDCIAVPKEISQKIERIDFENININKFNLMQLIKRIIIVILSLLTATGGLVFAKKYLFDNNSKYNLGKGIDTAVEYGYIYEPNLDSQTSTTISPDIIIDDAKLTISINDFLMDDQNISSTFKLEFDESLLEKINLKDIKSIELRDLLVTDEKNNILYCLDEEKFSNFCKENSLNYNVGEFNDNYYNSGVNIIIDGQETLNSINLIYNMYADTLYIDYPKSKKINYAFSKLILHHNEDKELVELNGNWKFEMDVPEVMYNRSNINYKVVSCPDNINVTKASASETGFEFACEINGISKPNDNEKYNETLKKYQNNEISEIEMRYVAYAVSSRELSPVVCKYHKEIFDILGETKEDCTYIKNENEDVFEVTFNPGRKYDYGFIDENTCYFYETFGLTKYDSTNKIFINLVWYNDKLEKEKTTIELNKN